jgi:hypothetical protein
MVVEALVTNFFFCFRVLWQLHSDWSHNSVPPLVQVLQWLEVSKVGTSPLPPAWSCCIAREGLGSKAVHLSPRGSASIWPTNRTIILNSQSYETENMVKGPVGQKQRMPILKMASMTGQSGQ